MPESPLYGIEHITSGDQQAEVLSNTAFDALESALSGSATFDAAGTGTIILDKQTEAIRKLTEFTGILTGDKTVEIPPVSKFYVFEDSTSGAFELFVGVPGGTQLKMVRGFKAWVYCDGVDTFDLTLLLASINRLVTDAVNLELYDRLLFCDTTGGAFSVTLPLVIPVGQRFLIVSTGSTNTLTIDRNTNTINEAAADPTIVTDQQAIEVIGQSATNWLAYRKTLA